MDLGVAINIRETVSEITQIAETACKGGVDRLWITDFPATRLAPIIAGYLAEKIKNCRIGVGLISPLLHRPSQILQFMKTLVKHYGECFDILLGPGDRLLLKKIGVSYSDAKSIVPRMVDFATKIKNGMREEGIDTSIWMGAQGPKMIKASINVDGVLLNYADPKMIQWAIGELLEKQTDFSIGVFPPTYITDSLNCSAIRGFMISATVVALGLVRSVAIKFGIEAKLTKVRELVRTKGAIDDEVIESFGEDLVQKFGLCGDSKIINAFLEEMEQIEVDSVVFGPPLGTKLTQVQKLVEELTSFGR